MDDNAKKEAIAKFLGSVAGMEAPAVRERLPVFGPGVHIVVLKETEYFQNPAKKGQYLVKASFEVLASTSIAPGKIHGYFSGAPTIHTEHETRARYTLQEMLKIGVSSFGLSTQDHEVMAKAYEDKEGLLTKWCQNELVTGNPIRIVAIEKTAKGSKIPFVALSTIEPAPDEKYWPSCD